MREGQYTIDLLKFSYSPCASCDITTTGALCYASVIPSIRNRRALAQNFKEIHVWSASTITLHWIKNSPYLIEMLVSNHVAEIQEYI